LCHRRAHRAGRGAKCRRNDGAQHLMPYLVAKDLSE